MMMPGLIVLIRAPALAPAHSFRHHAQGVGALGQLVGLEGSVTVSGCNIGSARSSSVGVSASSLSCSRVSAGKRWPDCDAITTPDPPTAITLLNECGPRAAAQADAS